MRFPKTLLAIAAGAAIALKLVSRLSSAKMLLRPVKSLSVIMRITIVALSPTSIGFRLPTIKSAS